MLKQIVRYIKWPIRNWTSVHSVVKSQLTTVLIILFAMFLEIPFIIIENNKFEKLKHFKFKS